jgi:anaerobic magnesium-protoporphyrin IX monomethyl ester cyclase
LNHRKTVALMDVLLVGRSGMAEEAPALGIAYLSSYLLSKGFSVGLARFGDPSIGEIVSSKQPRIVGISGLTIDMPMVYEVAGLVKNLSPDTVTIAGGLHPSALPKETLKECQSIDAVVIGEGEYTLAKIVSLKNIPKGLPTLDGVAYRNEAGIATTSKLSPRLDLDKLPYPLRSFTTGGVTKEIEEVGIHVARGCPYLCKGCSNHVVFGRKFRSRQPRNVVDEIMKVKAKYTVKHFTLIDEIPKFERAWLERFCKDLRNRRSPDDVTFGVFLRVEALTDHLARTLRGAGCTQVSFTVESGVDSLLKKYQADYTTRDVRKASAIAKKFGLSTQGYFSVGCPGETMETAYKTLDFIRELKLDEWWLGIRTPIPGTALYSEGKRQGLRLHRKWADYDMNPSNRKIDLPLVGTDLSYENLKEVVLKAKRSIPNFVS